MDTNSSTATLVVEGDIGIVTIDYPPVNALSRATREGILDRKSTRLNSSHG